LDVKLGVFIKNIPTFTTLLSRLTPTTLRWSTLSSAAQERGWEEIEKYPHLPTYPTVLVVGDNGNCGNRGITKSIIELKK
jgi:hypothetical protein